ncbi:MAG TPA: hypothetical protein VEC99_02180 [Clostridia bacterium]|nr:hypothetical protein [Clostridia bacterium]
MISPELQKLLCCPETRQDLHLADPGLISSLNSQFVAGKLRNRAGQPVSQMLEAGLIRSDGKFLYPIRQNIPVMIIEEAIPLQ